MSLTAVRQEVFRSALLAIVLGLALARPLAGQDSLAIGLVPRVGLHYTKTKVFSHHIRSNTGASVAYGLGLDLPLRETPASIRATVDVVPNTGFEEVVFDAAPTAREAVLALGSLVLLVRTSPLWRATPFVALGPGFKSYLAADDRAGTYTALGFGFALGVEVRIGSVKAVLEVADQWGARHDLLTSLGLRL